MPPPLVRTGRSILRVPRPPRKRRSGGAAAAGSRYTLRCRGRPVAANDNTSRKECTRTNRLSRFAARCSGVAPRARAHAQAPAYPAKSIRMIIALAPGGGVDTIGRFIGQRLSQTWGQPVVADNRPGAGGAIAAELVAKSPPDGYTLLMTSSGITVTPSLMKLDYDPHKDLLPVTLAVISPGVMVVHPSIPAKNVKELIAFAKARPDELFYSSSGQGSGQHLAMALFCQMTGSR